MSHPETNTGQSGRRRRYGSRLPISEARLTQAFHDLLDVCGWPRELRYHSRDSRKSSGSGFPDWCVVREGRIIFVELKSSRGKATREQLLWHDALIQAGAEAYIWGPDDRPHMERVFLGGEV